jgi:hypothetical protein
VLFALGDMGACAYDSVRVGPIHALLPLFVVRVWPEVKAANHSDLASDMQVDLGKQHERARRGDEHENRWSVPLRVHHDRGRG